MTMVLLIKPKSASMEYVLRIKDSVRKTCLTAASQRLLIHEGQVLDPNFDLSKKQKSPKVYNTSLYDVLAVVDAEYFLKYGMFPSAVVVFDLRSKRYRKEIVDSIRRFKALPSSMKDGDIVRAERERIMYFAEWKYYPEIDSYRNPFWWIE